MFLCKSRIPSTDTGVLNIYYNCPFFCEIKDLEHEHRAEIMEVQSEFKVQLEIELKRQAADLAYDYGEKIKKMEEDHQREVEEIQRKMEKSVKELEVISLRSLLIQGIHDSCRF